MQSTNTKLIQIKVQEDTLREISDVQEKIHSPSVSDTVRRSIGIVHALTKYSDKGDKIIIEGKNGERRQIIITGMR